MANQNNYLRYWEIGKLRLTELAQLQLQDGLIIYVHYYVEQVLENSMSWHYRETRLPFISISSPRVYLSIFPMNTLSRQKRATRRVMRKPCDMSFKCFISWLTEINHFLPLFPGSDPTKNIPDEELNGILLQAMPNSWAKSPTFKGRTFKWIPTGKLALCSSERKSLNKCMKENHLLKQLPG